MSSRLILGIAIICIIIGAILSTTLYVRSHTLPTQVACTMEAKLCPDGSYVGRSGPNCQFATCPNIQPAPIAQDKGSVVGQVTLSPTCPVERIPPDPTCAPKPYATLVTISGVHNFFIELHADTSGFFRTPLPTGTYTIMTHETNLYPRCPSQTVTITAGATTTADISCDTGIR